MSSYNDAEDAVIRALENMVAQGTELDRNALLYDLGLDSLDVIEMIMDIEDDLGIYIKDEDACKCETVGQLIDFIHRIIETQK
jgi:acyl carrier protein